MMKLSPKAVRFVIDALDHYVKYHDEQLAAEGLSDDDASDLANDRLYLESIKKDFEKYRDQIAAQRDGVNADA